MFRLFMILLVSIFNTDISQASEASQASQASQASEASQASQAEEKCIEQAAKVCIDESEKEVDGFKVKKCWKYKEVFRCTGREENSCDVFEDNRGCDEIKGKCLKPSPTGFCNHYEKTFACGHKDIAENKEIKLVSSEFNVIRDEKDFSGCDTQIKNKYCRAAEETCVEPGETRNINEKEVHKDCWKWDRKYTCRTNTKIDECKEYKEQGCVEKSRECIHEEEGRCDHYVVQYECEKNKTEKVDCVASKFCIGDVCEEQERNTNNNFGLAASYLGVLSQVQKDGESCGCNTEEDPNCNSQEIQSDKCQLFQGQKYVCRKVTGAYNCCSNKGFVRPFIGCRTKENELQSKQKAKLCHFVGSWKQRPLKSVQKKSYCCFNSPLARIIQEQGRAQLRIRWGKKNPDCRALTLQEIQRIDFSKINFEEVYADLKEKAKKDFALKGQDIAQKLKGYQSEAGTQNILKDKMKSFYGRK